MAPSMSDSEAFFLQSVQFYLVARENNNGFMGGPWNKIIAMLATLQTFHIYWACPMLLQFEKRTSGHF